MLLLLLILLCTVDAARILGVFPMPSISHQVVFRALTMELAKRGHELVIITPNPALTKDKPKDNITEIFTKNSYDLLRDFSKISNDTLKRGIICDVDEMAKDDAIQATFMLMAEIFNNEEVKQLLENKTLKFDLVIAEALTTVHFIFAKIFDAPLIAISSFYGFQETYELAGTVSRHPILYPNKMRNKFRNLSFLDKIREIYNEIKLYTVNAKLDDWENGWLQNKFGKDAPRVDELRDLVSILFLNSFPIFDNNRPAPPNLVYLGALHLRPVKELPEDLKRYMDNSKRGVVYVSLGSNVHPSLMEKELLDAFLNAFKEIPYDILWKFDGENLDNVPNNVRIQNWFPQRDLLAHPKLKVFVTQGGVQSTDEAIDAGMPLVGIPFMADQWYNVNKYVELGIGVQLDAFTLTADDIVKGVKTVATDDKFRQNLKRVKSIMYDTPQTPLERAVWWTEYVLRHKGAQHLKPPAANMSYAEYFMLDFILTLLGALILALVIFVYFLCYLISFFKSSPGKLKVN